MSRLNRLSLIVTTTLLVNCSFFDDRPSDRKDSNTRQSTSSEKAPQPATTKGLTLAESLIEKTNEDPQVAEIEAALAREEQARQKIEAERLAKEKAAKQDNARKEAEALALKEAEEKRQAEKKLEAEKLSRLAEAKKKEAEALDLKQAEESRKRAEAEALAKKQAEELKKAEALALAKKQEEARKKAEAAKALARKKEAERRAQAAKQALAKRNASSSASSTKLPTRSEVALNSTSYTPLGAEKQGNIAGTIPPWTGKVLGKPGFTSGNAYPNIYSHEQPMFTIHAGNYQDYSESLSYGVIELLKKYPDSFYMPVYPTHRDARYNALFEKRTAFNKQNTKMNNGIDGLVNYTGGIPFPAPQNGAEVMWNSRFAHPQQGIQGVLDDVAIYLNGNKHLRRQRYTIEFPFSNPGNTVGQTDDQIGINAGLVHITVEKPERIKGQMTIVHEALDQVTNGRKAWVYVPGSRRVRRAPSVGFDTPDGPGGLVTVDDSLGFNGAMERYNWKLVGKKEIYVPYHTYEFDSPDVDYGTLLQTAHANPDYMRYELHRTWIVEATLKPGASHVYAKRRFYIDEDSWHIVLLESYDGRGDLWRVGILNTVYDYAVQGYVARAQVFHDLQSGSYIALRLTNETEPSNLMASPRGNKYYSPSNLRKMGTR